MIFLVTLGPRGSIRFISNHCHISNRKYEKKCETLHEDDYPDQIIGSVETNGSTSGKYQTTIKSIIDLSRCLALDKALDNTFMIKRKWLELQKYQWPSQIFRQK